MAANSKLRKLATILTILLVKQQLQTSANANAVKTKVFLSPEMVSEGGFVSNKNYFNIGFPRGHIGVKSVNAELVDERGYPVPLHEAYLHHWVIQRYLAPKNTAGIPKNRGNVSIIRNSGICDAAVTQYFGLGAETRKTATDIPDPYGIQVGDPVGIPAGRLDFHF